MKVTHKASSTPVTDWNRLAANLLLAFSVGVMLLASLAIAESPLTPCRAIGDIRYLPEKGRNQPSVDAIAHWISAPHLLGRLHDEFQIEGELSGLIDSLEVQRFRQSNTIRVTLRWQGKEEACRMLDRYFQIAGTHVDNVIAEGKLLQNSEADSHDQKQMVRHIQVVSPPRAVNLNESSQEYLFPELKEDPDMNWIIDGVPVPITPEG